MKHRSLLCHICDTVKPAHAVTSINQSPVLKVIFIFACYTTDAVILLTKS